MGMQVFVGLPEVHPPYTRWGGACGVYRGFEVRVYDTSRPRPGGTDDPWSNNYKYYPAEGAVVTATFTDPESGWSTTVKKMVPLKSQQPVGETIAWVQLGTVIPCSICKGRSEFYIDITVRVSYQGQTWSKTYPKELYVSCPTPSHPSPYVITVKAGNITISEGKVCADMWLGYCAAGSFGVPIALYAYDNGVWRVVETRTVTLYKSPTKVCFDLPKAQRVGIAVRKPGTDTADGAWVCGKSWVIRL